MTVGLRIRDLAGNIVLDTSTGMARVLGSVAVPANSAGSLSNAAFGSGSPFAVSYPTGSPDTGLSQTYPTHSFSGTTLSWTSSPLPCLIVYGVYAGTSAGWINSGQIGFRARNGNQATQIDSSYKNHAVIAQGAVNIGVSNTQVITVTAQQPLIAYRGTGLVVVYRQINNGNGTWTITLVTGPYAASGTYYVFDLVQAGSIKSSSGIGLRIRNPSTGEVTFDSRLKYMRVVQVKANSAYQFLPDTPVTTALPRDNLAAIVDPGLWFESTVRQNRDDQGNIINQEVFSPYFVGAGVNGTTLTEGSVSVGTESTASPAYDQIGQTIVVDVSGY